MWTCSKCGTELAARSRSRSCIDHVIAKFNSHAERETRALFRGVVKLVAACGPYTLTSPSKGFYAFVANHHFATVNRNGAGRLDVHFALPRRLVSKRIWRIDRAGAAYMHHMRIRSANRIDAELAGWLRASYVEHGKRTADAT